MTAETARGIGLRAPRTLFTLAARKRLTPMAFKRAQLSPPPFYREIAAEMGLPVEEEALTMVLSDGSLRSDFIHPNAAGYRKLAESIAALLRKSGAVE
jgi:lysophospholipase L1-like esterase